MVQKGKSGSKASIGMKFRPSGPSTPNKTGSKPVPEQSSPQQIFLMVIIHLCRKILFIDTDIKLGFYLFLLFIVSTVGDFLPLPKTYFSDKNNVLNQYFVKLGWGWTFAVVGSFMMLTANIYCCGQRPRLRKHITRLVCATFAWYMMTSSFVQLERMTATCRTKTAKYSHKEACVEAGFKWSGFDISGHCFLLIFNSLFIMEEAKAIFGWTDIKDMIRKEDFARANSSKDDVDDTPLQHISDEEYARMKANYLKYTPYIMALFVSMTSLSLLWDGMLFATVLYFHTMVQKFAGGLVGIGTWYVLYRWLYPQGFTCLPGKGAFKYQKERKKASRQPFRAPSFVFKRRGSAAGAAKQQAAGKEEVPKFMGMPLNALKTKSGEAAPPDGAQ